MFGRDARNPKTFPTICKDPPEPEPLRVAAREVRGSAPNCRAGAAVAVIEACKCVPPACSMEPRPAPSAYDALLDALAAAALRDPRRRDRRRARPATAGDAVAAPSALRARRAATSITTDTRRLLRTRTTARRPAHWMQIARRSVRLARQAIAEEGREGEVAVAFSIDADIDRPDGARDRPAAAAVRSPREPPDLVIVEGLSVLRPTLYRDGRRRCWRLGLPVWLSFRRCRHGLCGVYGQHWGGPEGDAFGRAARRFEELGVGALLLGCIPPDHVDGMLSYLRDFTDLPLGVHPNLGYLTSNGWQRRRRRRSGRVRAHGPALARGGRPADRRLLRRRVRRDRRGARGAGRDAAGGAASRRRGVPRARRRPRGAPRAVGRHARALAVPARLPGPRRATARSSSPSQGSFLVWRHLFGERIGRGARCLDVGCGSGLQAIQLALNGAEHVHAIDVAADAIDATLVNAFRNGVVDRVSAAARRPLRLDARGALRRHRRVAVPAPRGPRWRRTPIVPVDYWGRNAVDHLIRILPRALADDGVAYVLQVSLLSQERTSRPARAPRAAGARPRLRASFPSPRASAAAPSRSRASSGLSDAHHLEVCGAT